MNMEKAVIGRTISYLVARDVWLALLVFGHTLLYYNVFSDFKAAIIAVLGTGAILWILFFTRLIRTVSIAKKDKYLVTAFGDEYFKNIKVRAGYHGYISMCLGCLGLILGNILFDAFSINVDIPIYIACEAVLLLGVITDDISKIFLSRG